MGAARMSDTVELVLVVELTAASEWMAGPTASPPHEGATRRSAAKGSAKPTRRRADTHAQAAHADIAATIAAAVSRMPAVSALSEWASSTIRAYVDPTGATQVLLSVDASGVERATARHFRELAPGVRLCTTIAETTLDRSRPLEPDDALPACIRDALGKPNDCTPSPALAARRVAWRRSTPDGAVVDIELHDVRAALCEEGADAAVQPARALERQTSPPATDAPDRTHAPIAFCELRLAAWIDEAPTAANVVSDSPLAAPESEPHAGIETSGAVGTQPGESAAPTIAALQSLFATADALAATLPVFPALTDGYARVCAATAAAAPSAAAQAARHVPIRAKRVDLSRARTPHDAFVAVSGSIARQWFGNESGVRARTDPEFVHQTRVALRRFKSLMKTFRRWGDETWERSIAPDLDWLGALLGQARDLDVFVDATLPMLVAADLDPSAWAPLQARAAARRDEAREQLRRALRTHRYAALSLAWLKWLAMQRLSAGPLAMTDKSLASYAAKRVCKHHARLCAKPGLTALSPAERHRRRIEAKRLRYTLEFFESLASRKTRRNMSKQLGRIQSVLGDGSDATAALRFLEALAAAPYQQGFARGWCEAVNRWSAVEGERLVSELRKPKIVRGR